MCVAIPAGLAAGLTAVSTLATVAGVGITLAGNAAATQAQVRAAEYKAKQARIQAQDALERGKAEESAKRREIQQLEGRQRALMAAGGLDLGSGSPLTILADTAQYGELDVQNIRRNARREADYYEEEGRLALTSAEDTKVAGMFSGFSTVVSGVGGLADKWYKPSYATPTKPKWGQW